MTAGSWSDLSPGSPTGSPVRHCPAPRRSTRPSTRTTWRSYAEQQVLVMCVLAAARLADGGLLKVPRVYNALITSNEPLLPSRAYPVSSPAVLLSNPYVAVEPAFVPPPPPPPAPAGNSSETEAAPATTPAAPAESTPELPEAAFAEGARPQDAVGPPAGGVLSVPYGSALPFPLSYYNPLGYSPFGYYPSFLAYSYPLINPGLALPFAQPHAVPGPVRQPSPALPAPALPSSDPVKNNKPENSEVPDVAPPPPPRGAASAGDKEAAAEAA